MSRIRILALFATLIALATALAACGGGGDEDPQKVVENATLKGVKSGNLEIALKVDSEGSEGGNLDLDISGPFQAGSEEELPQLAMKATAKGAADGEAIDFEGGLTLLSDRAFVNFKGTEYEVDPTTFGFLRSSLEQASQQEGPESAGNVTACQEAAAGFDFGQFVENPESEGGVDVDGTSTTKVSGDLNAGGAIDGLIELSEDPACATQLEAAGSLPLDQIEEVKKELTSAVKKAHVDLYVGDDDIIRKAAAELAIEPKGEGKVQIDLEMMLSEVNEAQKISAPANAKPLEGLFQQLGVNPLDLLETLSSGEGVGDVLEELGEATGGGSSGGSGGGSSSGGGEATGGGGGEGSSGGSPDETAGGESLDEQKEYVECLQGAESAADIQKCASLLQ